MFTDSDVRIHAWIAAPALLYVLLRAWLVPPVHDECASMVWFVQPGEWLPGSAHWDANDHYLSSGIGILLHRLFGDSFPALRLGSVLAYCAYAFAGRRFGVHLPAGLPRGLFWAAWCWCPFLLDFFSLFRGYGIAMAAWSWALVFLLALVDRWCTRDLLGAMACAVVANGSIIALVPPWALLLAVLLVLVLSATRGVARARAIAAWLLLGALPLAGGVALGLAFQERGLLYHGSTAGLLQVTVAPLARLVLGSDHPAVLGLLALLMVGSLITTVLQAWCARSWRSPAVVLAVLFWGDLLGRSVLAHLKGVNFPEDRAALHLVPEALLMLGITMREVAIRWPRAQVLSVVFAWPLAVTFIDLNLDHTRLWREQSVPGRFVDKVAERERMAGRPLCIGGHHQLALVWPLMARKAGLHSVLNTVEFPHGLDDLRIADQRHLDVAGFRVIDHAPGPGLWLLERARPLNVRTVHEGTVQPMQGPAEFVELLNLPDSLLHGDPLRMDVSVACSATPLPPDLALVWEVNTAGGAKRVYESLQLGAWRAQWAGDTLRAARYHQPAMADERVVWYLYNPRRVPLTAGPGALRVARLVD